MPSRLSLVACFAWKIKTKGMAFEKIASLHEGYNERNLTFIYVRNIFFS